MDFSDKIARYEEIERRGLLSQLPQEKQDMWAEYKRRQAKDSAVNNDAENNGKQSYLEQMAGKVATLDRGLTFGLGRKALGLTWAAGSKLGDTIVGNDNAPDFWGRYHEFVDPVVEAQQKYAEEHPAEALTAEIAAGIANPVNKVGAGFIGKGKSLSDVAARASAVGGGVGGVAGAMNTEYAKDLFPNTAAGVGVGAAMGGILPVAANRAGAVYNAIKRITAPEASVAGKATGLGNIVKDNESVRALSRGIMADDAVAAQVLQEAPTQMGRLNEELSEILNKTTGRKLNIEGAKQNADEAYKSYVAANADYPVYTTEEIAKPTKEQLLSYPAESNFNAVERNRMDSADLLRERVNQAGIDIYENPKSLKEFQFDKIQEMNPHDDSLGNHTWIKNVDDIKTADEVWSDGEGITPDFTKKDVENALKNRKVTVYSSHEIKDGVFVTPSRMEAQNYAGDGKVHSKTVPLSDVAWIDGVEGQYVENTGGVGHFLGKDRTEYLRTLNETLEKPDASFIQKNGNKASFRKYYNNTEKPFDYVVQDKNNNLYTKFMTDAGYLNNRIQETPNSISIRGNNLAATNNGYAVAPQDYMYNITQNGANVKQNVPNIKDIVGQLNEFKQNAMNKALAEGAAMSDYGAGSLDAVHKAQGVLNDMIENSFDKSVLGVKRPTTQTAELMGLKQVFTNMLEPSGVKSLDARIAKAKSLEYFYDMGYKFKPSEKKFEDLGIKTLRDKRAFLQGRLQSILDNVKDDKNLAKAIRADENTLKKLMPAKQFDELLRETSEIDRQYTRLNKYIQLANRELDKPLAADRPMSERGESKLSYLGSLYDKANALMWQNANRRRAQALLNGGAQNPEVLAALERLAGRYNLGQISPYIAQLAAQNQ